MQPRLTKAQEEQLRSLGWDFVGYNNADIESFTWAKFRDGEIVARQGDRVWIKDLEGIIQARGLP